MLGAPPADGHEDDGDVDGGEDGEDRGEGSDLSGWGHLAGEEVADVEEPEDEGAGEARVPGPPDSPDGTGVEHAGEQHEGAVEDGDLGGGEGEGVGGEGLEGVAVAQVEIGE